MKSENVVSNSMFLKTSLFVKQQNNMVVVAVRRKRWLGNNGLNLSERVKTAGVNMNNLSINIFKGGEGVTVFLLHCHVVKSAC